MMETEHRLLAAIDAGWLWLWLCSGHSHNEVVVTRACILFIDSFTALVLVACSPDGWITPARYGEKGH